MITLIVERSLFIDFPTFRRGIIAATNLRDIGKEADIGRVIGAASTDSSCPVLDREEILTPAWRETFAGLGYYIAPYFKFLSEKSVGGDLNPSNMPRWIWRLAACVVQEFGLPVGVFDLERARPILELARASSEEELVNHSRAERIKPREILFFNAARKLVLARAWNLEITEEERGDKVVQSVLLTVDSIGSESDLALMAAMEAVFHGLQQGCRGPMVMGKLDAETTGYRLLGPRPDQTDPGRLTLALEKIEH